jgi:hypothetical protein
LAFNKVVGVDTVFVNFNQKEYPILNMLDWGTNRQICAIISEGLSSQGALKTFLDEWVKHYGLPETVVVDQGTEFTGDDFKNGLSGRGVLLHYCDARSPWQNARTERAGGDFKEKLLKLIEDMSITTELEFEIALAETCAARNRLMDRSGFSPDQRTFGCSLRLPASLLSDDVVDRIALEDSASEDMIRAWDIRDAAMRGRLESQDREAYKRAAQAKARTQRERPIEPGSWVKVWRRNANRGVSRSCYGCSPGGAANCLGTSSKQFISYPWPRVRHWATLSSTFRQSKISRTG